MNKLSTYFVHSSTFVVISRDDLGSFKYSLCADGSLSPISDADYHIYVVQFAFLAKLFDSDFF